MTSLRLPTFIIAGAPRSATTWLYRVADAHPGIAMARPETPEPKFFLVDDLYQRGLKYYSQTWFEALDPDLVLGEKSTNYLESPTAAQRISQDLPNVRLVFMLRNPVARAHSNYLWTKRNGLETESFARALELEAQREAAYPAHLRYARPFSYFSRGLYAALLQPWFACFDRKNVLVLFTEDVERNPDQVADQFYGFLNVTPSPALARSIGVVNQSGDNAILDAMARSDLSKRYKEANARLAALLGREAMPW